MDEYKTCILGLRLAIGLDVQKILVIGDSNLLIHRVQGSGQVSKDSIVLGMCA